MLKESIERDTIQRKRNKAKIGRPGLLDGRKLAKEKRARRVKFGELGERPSRLQAEVKLRHDRTARPCDFKFFGRGLGCWTKEDIFIECCLLRLSQVEGT